jgi:hypothetical protein
LGDCFALVAFFKNYRSSKHNWATVFQNKSYLLILTKNGLGYILGEFSKTHLVTLNSQRPHLSERATILLKQK